MELISAVIAWTFLVGGCIGFVLSALDKLAADEPRLTLCLSWLALVYAAFTAVIVT